MFASSHLDEMCRIDIDTIDANNMADIGTIKIDGKLPLHQRMEQYLNQINNPYCFRSGKIKVKIAFTSDGDALENALTNFFVGLKNC